MDNAHLAQELYTFGLERGWHLIEAKWGRKGSASLLSHSLTVMGIAERLADIEGWSKADKRLALVLAFLHDVGKEHPEFRDKEGYTHKDLKKRLPDGMTIEGVVIAFLNRIGFSREEVDSIVHMLPYGKIEGAEHFEYLLMPRGRDVPHVRRMVHEDADGLASLKSPREVEGYCRGEDGYPHLRSDESLRLAYHSVGTVRGVLTLLVHKAMHTLYENAGWHPLLFFPEGTIYVGRGDEPDLSRLEDYIVQELQSFIKSLAENMNLGAEAVGRITAKAIETPEYLYLSDGTVMQFWERVRHRNEVDNPNVERILGASMLEHSAEPESEAKELEGLYRMLIYLKEIVKQCTHDGEDKEAQRVFLRAFEQEFPNVSKDVLIRLEGISHTKPVEERLEMGALFRQGLEGGMLREQLLDEVRDKFARITRELREFGEKYCGLDYHGIARELLAELVHPRVLDQGEIIGEVWHSYNEGKNRGTPLCMLCSKKPAGEAIAALVGKSQSFTNFLKGGSHIGVGNKYRICSLCELEMKLRSPYLGTSDCVEYYVIPQISLSPEGMERWAELVEAVTEGRKIGIEELFALRSDYEWSSAIVHEGLDVLNQDAAALLRKMQGRMANAKNLRKLVEGYVRDEYDEGGEPLFLDEVGASSLDEAVQMLIEGTLPEEHMDKLKQKMGDGGGVLMELITPNYMVVSYRMMSRDVRDADYLRHLFRMLLISRLFGASVVLKDVRCEPLRETVSKGAAYLPASLGLKRALRELHVEVDDGWVSLEDVDTTLRRLSAVLQLASIVGRVQRGREKRGLLLDIISKPHGRTLSDIAAELTPKQKGTLKDVIRLLNMLEEECA